MAKIDFKNTLKNIGLMLLILLVIGYNVYYFLIAPHRAHQHRLDQLVSDYHQEAVFINEFNYKDRYIFVEVENNVIVLNSQGDELDSIPKTSIPASLLTESSIALYGYAQDEIIYVIKNESSERWFDRASLELIFERESE